MGLFEGFLGALTAAVFFGSNYIPVKKYEMGDGMYFQFIMAVGIWVVGLFYFIYQEPSTGYFHPFALLGGVIWSIGNVLTVPIIKMIGMALGLSIWSATNLIVGWVLGKNGWLGFAKDDSVKIAWLNYVGVCFEIIALCIFFLVKPADKLHEEDLHGHLIAENTAHIFNPNIDHESSPAIWSQQQSQIQHETNLLKQKDMKLELEKVQSWIDKLSNKQKQLFGIIMSILSGLCYGTCFSPIQYLINYVDNDDDNFYYDKLEDYTFCHYCGILIASITWFVIYCIYTRNQPQINNESTFPSILSGSMWAIAQIGFFIAMDKQNLGADTTFPIVSGSPQIIASLWGVVWFKEVKPGKNMLVLLSAILVGVVGVVCITLSKFDI